MRLDFLAREEPPLPVSLRLLFGVKSFEIEPPSVTDLDLKAGLSVLGVGGAVLDERRAEPNASSAELS